MPTSDTSPVDASRLYRGRFAPSPTGRLHFGSLVAAVGSWLCARAAGGAWIVRVEDIDPPREIAGATDDILATLAAFGLESDEPIARQSERADRYAKAFAKLDAMGAAYPCWCSRLDLAPFGGVHPPQCVASPDSSRTPAWRVRVADAEVAFDDASQGRFAQNLRRDVGDFVVRRVEGWYAYQLAVVVDDAAQGISDVVRGADLLDSTPRQIFLQHLLDLPQPSYRHLPLVVDAEGRKLSKQDRARPVDASDPLPALRAALAFLAQRPSEATTPTALLVDAVAAFDPAAIPKYPASAATNPSAAPV